MENNISDNTYVAPDMEMEEFMVQGVICQSGSIPNLVLDSEVNWFDE